MQITCVVGLPGSGKTTFVRNTWNELTDWIIDDQGAPLQTCLEWAQKTNCKYGLHMLWITDPYFCITEVRVQAEHKLQDLFGVQPNWMFFENDPEACWQNVLRRQDGRKVRGLIHALQSRYQIPPGATVLPVWRPSE